MPVHTEGAECLVDASRPVGGIRCETMSISSLVSLHRAYFTSSHHQCEDVARQEGARWRCSLPFRAICAAATRCAGAPPRCVATLLQTSVPQRASGDQEECARRLTR